MAPITLGEFLKRHFTFLCNISGILIPFFTIVGGTSGNWLDGCVAGIVFVVIMGNGLGFAALVEYIANKQIILHKVTGDAIK